MSLGGGAAGSMAGVPPGALQQVSSVTSKTSDSTGAAAAGASAGGLLGGIDWAAIKSEALKAAPAAPPAAAKSKASAAAAGDAGGDDDAPYNPMEEDEQPYDPTEGDVSTPAAVAAAGAQAGGSTDATAAGFPDIPDMLPVVCERPPGAPPGPTPGQLVWHGCFVVSHGSFFSGHVQHLGGVGEPGRMLGPPGGNVSVMGRVALDKFAEFARELRSSRSRTISLGLVSVAPGAPGPEGVYCRELREGYSAKGRIGKLALAKEVEGYLVAPSGE